MVNEKRNLDLLEARHLFYEMNSTYPEKVDKLGTGIISIWLPLF